MLLLLVSIDALLSAQSAPPLSLTLAQAENLALSSADALRIQDLKIRSSARRLALGVRDYLPQIELGFSTADTVNLVAQDALSKQLSLTVREPIYNGGRASSQRSLARVQLILTQHGAAVAREDVLNDVWDKFHQVLVLQSQRAVKLDALTQSRQQLAIARTERGLGMIREIDLLDVELTVSNQEIDLQSTETDIDNALYALKKAIGLSPGQDLSLEGRIDSDYEGISIEQPVSELFAIAQRNNLDVQSAGYKVNQMEAQLALARSSFLPQIAANLSLSVAGPDFPLQTPSVMLGLDISFPDAAAPVKGSASGGVTGPTATTRDTSVTIDPLQAVTGGLDERDARLQLEEARVAMRALTRDLDFQIGQSISTYRRHATTIALERQARDLQQRKLKVLAQQVSDGSATRVDYLKQQTEAADQEVQLLSDILSLIRDERTLERLIGLEPGGLDQPARSGS